MRFKLRSSAPAIKILRQEIPDFDARVEKERAKLAARKVETAKDPHSRPGNQNAKKRDENAEVNYPREKKRKGNNGNADPERIIARLKRDAADNPQTQALLDTLNATPQLAGDPAAAGAEGKRNAGGDLI